MRRKLGALKEPFVILSVAKDLAFTGIYEIPRSFAPSEGRAERSARFSNRCEVSPVV